MPSLSRPLTVMFWPESAYGPTNQCIGLAAILAVLTTVVFICCLAQIGPTPVLVPAAATAEMPL